MKIQEFPITIHQDESGWYVVECPVIPGWMSQGQTKEWERLTRFIGIYYQIAGEFSFWGSGSIDG